MTARPIRPTGCLPETLQQARTDAGRLGGGHGPLELKSVDDANSHPGLGTGPPPSISGAGSPIVALPSAATGGDFLLEASNLPHLSAGSIGVALALTDSIRIWHRIR